MKIPKINKKIALITGVIALGSIGGVSATMANQPKTGADTSPIVTEVDQQHDKLNNHEARITNLETNQRVLQTSTNTQPSSSTVAVPVVRDVNAPTTTTSTTATAATPDAPAPVTVTAYKEIPLDSDNCDCEYTYSDGTTYRFAWKRTTPQGSWMTDGNGNNGHWVKAINKSGFCDDRAIGKQKLN